MRKFSNKANPIRSSSNMFPSGNINHKPEQANFVLPNKSSMSNSRIALRSLKEERLKRQVSRSNSPVKIFEQPFTKLNKANLAMRLKPCEVACSYDGSSQALKIALAENSWNKMKRAGFRAPEKQHQESVDPVAGLKKYLTKSKMVQNHSLAYLGSSHVRQLSAAIASQKYEDNSSNKDVLKMALAIKNGLEQCSKKPVNQKKRTISYFEASPIRYKPVKDAHHRYHHANIKETDNDESTEENSKIHTDYLCARKAHLKPNQTSKRRIATIKDTSNNDSASGSDIILPTESENSPTNNVVWRPNETKVPKLIKGM